MVNKILSLRAQHPAIGARKLKRMLENNGIAAPAYSTINDILKRHGCITPEASQAAKPLTRFEKAAPNDMWQVDFKGHFAMTDGQRCHPLTVIDDHSRYCISLKAHRDEQFEGVRASLYEAFVEHGLPGRLLCDNGNPWGTSQSVGYTRMEVWLMDLGVLTLHGRAHHPQTQGKDERFNGTLKQELLRFTDPCDLADAQHRFDDYRAFYNHHRPHHALSLEVPAFRYRPSLRPLPKTIEPWTYPAGYAVRRVKSSGYVTFRGQGYFVSEAFSSLEVGLCDSPTADCVDLYYRQFRVACIDVNERVVISRKPRLPSDR
jgi:transposase InsO family protein